MVRNEIGSLDFGDEYACLFVKHDLDFEIMKLRFKLNCLLLLLKCRNWNQANLC